MTETRPLSVALREVKPEDVSEFFAHQLDPVASRMAAFTAKDPANRRDFNAHWQRLFADEEIVKRTVTVDGAVAGNMLSCVHDGRREVCYWIDRQHWGQGVATCALAAFLNLIDERPLYARAAKDNVASIRVLEKCGFKIVAGGHGFANARGEEIEEVLLEL